MAKKDLAVKSGRKGRGKEAGGQQPAAPEAANGHEAAATSTTTVERPSRPKRQRQGILPDPAFERIREIEAVAEMYVTARDERMAQLESEVKLKERLVKVMKKHNLETYSFDGYMVELTHVEAADEIKVKKKRAVKEDGSQA
jgi:hypothetical protein